MCEDEEEFMLFPALLTSPLDRPVQFIPFVPTDGGVVDRGAGNDGQVISDGALESLPP